MEQDARDKCKKYDKLNVELKGRSPKHGNKIFVFILLLIIAGYYSAYFYLCIFSPEGKTRLLNHSFWRISIGILHMHLLLLLFSYVAAIQTEPGAIPPHWGFYVGDDARRIRYCGICQVWKPDRAHHCSVCNRCVLNMDHHCPWINNCVGFYNRKFFIQALFFANSCLLNMLIQM